MINLDNLCMGCMKDREGQTVCPHCGYNDSQPQLVICLPRRTVLQDRYVVGKRLDSNGEGIGYLGYDSVAGTPVYIREFMPENLASRKGSSAEIIPGCELTFQEYREEFLRYFRAIARLRELSSMIPIYDIFEENNTAYTVSEWVESITLQEFIQRSGGRADWNTIRPLFMPVLSSLSAMHASGVSHLGISPQNLVILRSGKMKLTGFSIRAVRQMDTDLIPELFPGCSAIEQYVMNGPISESSDVYGFTACLFFALTGILPQDALKRKNDARLMIPTSILREIPPHVVTALANGLQVDPSNRTATFERLRAELSAAPTVTMVQNEVAAPPQKPPVTSKAAQKSDSKSKGLPNFVWGILSCIFALVVIAIVLLILYGSGGWGKDPSGENSAVSSMSDTSSSLESLNQVDIPNLVNLKYEDAEKTAQESNSYQILKIGETFSDTIQEGYIVSQNPDPKEQKMMEGTVISVQVSKGPRMRTLPDIEGDSLTEAASAVTAQGLVPVKSEEERYDDYIPAGQVIGYRSHVAGDKVEYGNTVEIVVSKGKSPSSSEESSSD